MHAALIALGAMMASLRGSDFNLQVLLIVIVVHVEKLMFWSITWFNEVFKFGFLVFLDRGINDRNFA